VFALEMCGVACYFVHTLGLPEQTLFILAIQSMKHQAIDLRSKEMIHETGVVYRIAQLE
jgi:hypothetical protein